jgi:soluble lytic murein transglycosylase-like protein
MKAAYLIVVAAIAALLAEWQYNSAVDDFNNGDEPQPSPLDGVINVSGTVAGALAKLNLPDGTIALIDKYADEYGVDRNLMYAQAWQESRGKQFDRNGNVLTSSAGALGIFQLMPATAVWLGVDPMDAEQNVKGGIKFMAALLQRYNGDFRLALAAYNAGPGAVSKYGNTVPPYKETQQYVSIIDEIFSGLAG